MSADAWLMAQPWPVQEASAMMPSSPRRTWSTRSSPHEGFTPSWVCVASSIS